MADEERDPFYDIGLEKSWNQYSLGVLSVVTAPHDPEDTLQVGMTQRDLAVSVFALLVLTRVIPELGGVIENLLSRLNELATFQQFFPSVPGGDNE